MIKLTNRLTQENRLAAGISGFSLIVAVTVLTRVNDQQGWMGVATLAFFLALAGSWLAVINERRKLLKLSLVVHERFVWRRAFASGFLRALPESNGRVVLAKLERAMERELRLQYYLGSRRKNYLRLLKLSKSELGGDWSVRSVEDATYDDVESYLRGELRALMSITDEAARFNGNRKIVSSEKFSNLLHDDSRWKRIVLGIPVNSEGMSA